ncbi:hypothetical protein GEMRC1_013552 [Eukaryota sp. GEM-RC1]
MASSNYHNLSASIHQRPSSGSSDKPQVMSLKYDSPSSTLFPKKSSKQSKTPGTPSFVTHHKKFVKMEEAVLSFGSQSLSGKALRAYQTSLLLELGFHM